MEKDLNIYEFYFSVTTGLQEYAKIELINKFKEKFIDISIVKSKIRLTSIEMGESEFVILINDMKNRVKSCEHIYLVLEKFEITEKNIDSFAKNFFKCLNGTKRNLSGMINKIFLENSRFRVDIKKSKFLKDLDKNEMALKFSEVIEKCLNKIPDTSNFDIKFYFEKFSKELMEFSLKITKDLPLGLSQVSVERELTDVCLRPSIAYCMTMMIPSEIPLLIIDPMCGASTICEIANKHLKTQHYYISCDNNIHAMEKSHKNIKFQPYIDVNSYLFHYIT